MQNPQTLRQIIKTGRPDVPDVEVELWIHYISQLKGCSLQSVASQALDQDDWLKARGSGIGGSEIAAILGKSPWNSARQIWLTKTGQFSESEKKPQSEQARWGNVLETTIADEWAKRENRNYINIPVILRDDAHPFMFANIDGFTLSEDRTQVEGILEIKTTSAFNKDAWETGPVPEYYMCQANWYCTITGLPAFDIVCLIGGQKLVGYHFPVDQELCREMRKGAEYFWNENVQKMIEPEAQASDMDTLKELEHTEESIVIEDEGVENVAEMYIQLRDKIGQLSKVKDALYAQLFAALGTASSALTLTHTISIAKSERRNCDLLKLQQEYPEAYNECVGYTVSTSLKIK